MTTKKFVLGTLFLFVSHGLSVAALASYEPILRCEEAGGEVVVDRYPFKPDPAAGPTYAYQLVTRGTSTDRFRRLGFYGNKASSRPDEVIYERLMFLSHPKGSEHIIFGDVGGEFHEGRRRLTICWPGHHVPSITFDNCYFD